VTRMHSTDNDVARCRYSVETAKHPQTFYRGLATPF